MILNSDLMGLSNCRPFFLMTPVAIGKNKFLKGRGMDKKESFSNYEIRSQT